MRFILDTGVFYHPGTLREVVAQGVEVVVPAVAFTERARQLRRDGRSVEDFTRLLLEHAFVVEPYGLVQALRRAVHVADDRTWARHARDAMIAGHVGPEDVLWTTNRADFEAFLDPHQIQDVP